jgi:hypothetical protein
MDNANIFSTTDIFGKSVSLSRSTWENHIVKGHPEMTCNEAAVKKTVEEPSLVVGSTWSTSSSLYFSKVAESTMPHLYTGVVVDAIGDNKGMVTTAYFTKKIRDSAMQGGVLYEAE